MAHRKWDSQHPDTLYGDAAARVLCRIYKREPGGRTLQECLNKTFVLHDSKEAVLNAINGDGSEVECKAALRHVSSNVCMSTFEMEFSQTKVLLAWVPGTEEICWVATMEDVRNSCVWLEKESCWLIPRDKITPL